MKAFFSPHGIQRYKLIDQLFKYILNEFTTVATLAIINTTGSSSFKII